MNLPIVPNFSFDLSGRPVSWDPNSSRFIAVAGRPGTGKTVALGHLSTMATAAGWHVLARPSLFSDSHDAVIEFFGAVLDRVEQRIADRSAEPVLVVVDDYIHLAHRSDTATPAQAAERTALLAKFARLALDGHCALIVAAQVTRPRLIERELEVHGLDFLTARLHFGGIDLISRELFLRSPDRAPILNPPAPVGRAIWEPVGSPAFIVQF